MKQEEKRKIKKNWTQKEDEIIKKCVRENFHTISNAFEIAAEKLGVSYYSVHKRWYRTLCNQETIFMAISEKTVMKNKKKSTYAKNERGQWYHKTNSSPVSRMDVAHIRELLNKH